MHLGAGRQRGQARPGDRGSNQNSGWAAEEQLRELLGRVGEAEPDGAEGVRLEAEAAWVQLVIN